MTSVWQALTGSTKDGQHNCLFFHLPFHTWYSQEATFKKQFSFKKQNKTKNPIVKKALLCCKAGRILSLELIVHICRI